MKRVEEIVALRDVLMTRLRMPERVSPDYALRKIMREYSKAFHTPLHEVYDLPIEHVLRAYYEETFETLEDKDLQDEARDLSRSEEEEREERAKRDILDAEFFRDMEDIKREEVAKQKKKLEEVVQSLAQTADIARQMMASRQGRETTLTNVKTAQQPLPERITMRFEDVDLESDSFGILEDPVVAPKNRR
jgi:hypothetical protein